jgi:hypothetical protein
LKRIDLDTCYYLIIVLIGQLELLEIEINWQVVDSIIMECDLMGKRIEILSVVSGSRS